MHLGITVRETNPGSLEPPDLANLWPGPSGLPLCFPFGRIQQGIQKGADAVGVQVLGRHKTPWPKAPGKPATGHRRAERTPGSGTGRRQCTPCYHEGTTAGLKCAKPHGGPRVPAAPPRPRTTPPSRIHPRGPG